MVQACLEAGSSIFKIWGVSAPQALLGSFRGVRSNLFLASLVHLHCSGAKHFAENSLKSALRGIWALQRVCVVRGSKLKILSTKGKENDKKQNLPIDYIILKCYDATKMRNNTKAMRLNTRAKLSWYRCAWRPVFQFSKFRLCRRPTHCWEVSRCAG